MEPPEGFEERRTSVAGATSTVKLYVIAVVVCAAMTIAGVITIAILMPVAQSGTVITAVVGITAPIILALLAGGQHAMAVAMDGKLSQLVRAEKGKEHAEGVVEGLRENPRTNIE